MFRLSIRISVAIVACVLSAAAPQASASSCAYIQTIGNVAGYGTTSAHDASGYVNKVLANLAPTPTAACKQLIGLSPPRTLTLGGTAHHVQFSGTAFFSLGDRGRLPYSSIDNVTNQLNAAPPAAVPIFSIIDSNAAHHFSEPLIRLAFHGSPRPRAIVQIDQHPDITSGTGTDLDCTNWGRFALTAAQTAGGAHTAVYIWVGPATPAAAGNFTVKSYTTPGTVLATANTNAAGLGAEVLAKINAALGTPADFDVYVSVDRDFHAYGATGWDVYGKHSPTQARPAVAGIINAFPHTGAGGHLRGFDVVGMPVTGTPSASTEVLDGITGLGTDRKMGLDPRGRKLVDLAIDDVHAFWTAAQAKLRL